MVGCVLDKTLASVFQELEACHISHNEAVVREAVSCRWRLPLGVYGVQRVASVGLGCSHLSSNDIKLTYYTSMYTSTDQNLQGHE